MFFHRVSRGLVIVVWANYKARPFFILYQFLLDFFKINP
jgi:hypothetical protein